MTWKETRLKHLCVDSGQYGLNIAADSYSATGTRLIRTSDITANGTLKDAESAVRVDVPIEPRYQLLHGDILLSRSGTLGRSFLVPDQAQGHTFAGFLIRFRPKSGVDPRYLHYATQSARFQGTVHAEAVASTIQNFNADRYANISMCAPVGEEQRRIADFLDVETSKLEVLDGRFTKLTRLLEERKAALIAACFAFKVADDVPVLPLRRAVERWIDYRGATPEKTESGIPLVTAKNIRNGRIDLEVSREFIATDAYADWMRRGLLEVNDVLLTTEAPLGQVAMVNDTFIALAQRVIVLRAHQDVCSPEWLYWYLLSPQGQAELELRSTGSTALGIKADRLRGVPIPLPTLREATQRLGQLADRVTQIEALERKLAEQRALVAERRQALITAAVTGQFDVTTASGRNVTEGVPA
ncbi:restriction endonuclease subunit S [Streptomyces sp. NRRL F-2799]|uniref:restriction endonuclease subunit S n=1 Tax=Streptomyces sp. NRRL F-2799 TaxID=1463844 RepID=UPI00099CEAC5|nr:restriction endonuclease subunit S [Streptomyces sp. NRRL F-2799]